MSQYTGPGTGSAGPESGDSSLGLEPKIGGLLCYALGVLTGIAFLVLERRDPDIRFHAYQSFATFGGLWVIWVGSFLVPILGPIVQGLLSIVGFVLWVFLMVKALQGERYRLPIVGDWAAEQVEQGGRS